MSGDEKSLLEEGNKDFEGLPESELFSKMYDLEANYTKEGLAKEILRELDLPYYKGDFSRGRNLKKPAMAKMLYGVRRLKKFHELYVNQETVDSLTKNTVETEGDYVRIDHERRDESREKTEDIPKREHIQFPKESWYYSCPKCEGIIKVKSEKRPLRVGCPSCGTEYIIRKARSYPCQCCGSKLNVETDSSRFQCPSCMTMHIISKKPTTLELFLEEID